MSNNPYEVLGLGPDATPEEIAAWRKENGLPEAPAGVPDSFKEHVELMFDIQALAFAADARALRLAKGWVDVGIWNQSRLPVYVKEGEWTELFKMVADGNSSVDYLSRSVLEAETEAQHGVQAIGRAPELVESELEEQPESPTVSATTPM